MTETAQFTIGCTVEGTDGPCGELRRVVVDPIARTLTHLVVEPRLHHHAGRLVPIDLVASCGKVITLTCSEADFQALKPAQETEFLPCASGQWGYAPQQMLSWPYYGLELEGARMNGSGRLGAASVGPVPSTHDRVPLGEIEVRRGDAVHASDGEIGRIQGLVVDRGDHQVTHVLLAAGHLWGHRTVAIPIHSVATIDDGVRVGLTKSQVRDLPRIEVDRRE